MVWLTLVHFRAFALKRRRKYPESPNHPHRQEGRSQAQTIAVLSVHSPPSRIALPPNGPRERGRQRAGASAHRPGIPRVLYPDLHSRGHLSPAICEPGGADGLANSTEDNDCDRFAGASYFLFQIVLTRTNGFGFRDIFIILHEYVIIK